MTYFFKKYSRGNHAGCDYGFPFVVRSKCWVNQQLKVKAINKCNELIAGNPHIIGIAYDEPERYKRICVGNKISLLYEQGITEETAKEICNSHGLLSPLYVHASRDGCWFCNQMNIRQSMYIKAHYPELVNELLILEQKRNVLPNSNYFARGNQTVSDFYNRKYKHSKYNYLDKFF